MNEKTLTEILKDAGITYSPLVYLVETLDPKNRTETYGIYSNVERARERARNFAKQWTEKTETEPNGYIHCHPNKNTILIKYPNGMECIWITIREAMLDNGYSA